MKNIFAFVFAIVIAFAMLWIVSEDNIYECPAVVTETFVAENGEGVVVVDVDMPSGQIHEWAFYGEDYAVGDDVVVELDLYNDILRDAWHV